ncbi:glutamate-5-semialdehyde dehydrogenase, partial [bacterium]|nr:glutamate-5-semialdehyde dehydrogenase [bacterium]
IGVIAVIFESRPDALPQIASLCLKSGNAVLLKGGSEAIHSNRALTKVLDEAAQSEGIPAGWISLLETREEIAEILKLEDDIDLIIPRGSNAFVRYIMDNTNIPVTGHRDGICHTYIHAAADLDKAVRITVDGKCQYPAVCNATETLLIDRAASPGILPVVAAELVRQGVELRLDPEAKRLIDTHCKENPGCYDPGKIRKAEEEDWSTEYLDLILSVRIVDGLEQAVEHINRYGSHHTDAIVTEDEKAAKKFITLVDSSSVLHNASTRFADGFRYGFGAEIGISTEKIHSRGPVGLEGLTIYKYILKGHGQIVADYSGPNARKFTHKPQPGAKGRKRRWQNPRRGR